MIEWTNPEDIFKKIKLTYSDKLSFESDFVSLYESDSDFYLLIYGRDKNYLKMFEIQNYQMNPHELKELQMHCNAQDEKIYQDAAEKIADFIMSMKASNYFFDAH